MIYGETVQRSVDFQKRLFKLSKSAGDISIKRQKVCKDKVSKQQINSKMTVLISKNQGHTMILHTYSSQSMSLSSINILHLTVSEI